MKYLQLLLLTLALPLLTHTYPAAEEKSSTALDDVGVDNDEAASAKDSQLQKRSGSTDYALHLKSGLLSGLGHASASIASSSSGGSSGGGYGYKPHGGDGHHLHGHVEFDPWSLKKTVLNTIFQAVKAITGGVTALKGQLIKGSGYALSASGNLVAASGDKVTDVGKYIINSAQSKLHPIPSGHGGGGGGSFGKFASLSGASSGGSSNSGGKHPGPVVHTESITSYEIPHGHTSYGPPSKAPSYSSATHQYLPPSGNAYPGGSAGYGGGHVAFEEPSSNYLPTAYGPDVNQHQHQSTNHHHHHVAAPTGQEFNIYGRHKKLNDEETRKAAAQLQEILNMLPNGKTEYTASKTVALDTSNFNTGYGGYDQTGSGNQVDFSSYGLPTNLGQLESLSHTESITAAYAADIYHQMQKQKKLSPEEAYIQKHPQEGYDYKPANDHSAGGGYKYENNYKPSGSGAGSANDALKDLTPIIAALEVAKRQNPTQATLSYAVEKNVHKVQPSNQAPGAQYIPPAVKKTKYIYYPPTPSRYQEYHSEYKPAYNGPYKVRRHVPEPQMTRRKRKAPLFRGHDYGNQDHIMYNPLIGGF